MQSDLNKIQQLAEAGRALEAQPLAQRFTREHPDDPNGWYLLASVQSMLGQLEEVIACCRKAVALDPNRFDALYNLGVALQQRNRLDEAAECYRRTLALKPDFAPAHTNLGMVIGKMQELVEAEAANREAIRKQIGAATQFLQRGNLPQAELICRYLIKSHGEDAEIWVVLGKIALATELDGYAEDYFRRAAAGQRENLEAAKGLAIVKARKEQRHSREMQGGTSPGNTAGTPRFLLIKAWGFGFWSDMDHVLGQLLLAEIAGRVPVVHWGDNCLFRGDGDNAFEAFFERVSPYTLEDVRRLSSSFFPPKWTHANLHANNVNKCKGPHSCIAGFQLLERSEDTVVSDFFTHLNDIVPWIPESSPYYGVGTLELYRRIFRKHIRLTSTNAARVEAFWQARLAGRKPLAVHVRGSDKLIESDRLHEANMSYHEKIAEFMGGRCDSVFLLTDSVRVLDEFRARYVQKLIFTDCMRSDGDTGVHYQPRANPQQTGIEVVVDTYLAARCACFIGNGHSNVSTSILHLRDWKEGECELFGENRLMQPNFLLHKR